ncbi:RidA family protein [Amycolatopsis coloradensis]|uniref:RidA family protein n=1 Tax=Amycolatopsis coloradensis TaxID=76021 RepID=A0ACD5BH32_9PSEU
MCRARWQSHRRSGGTALSRKCRPGHRLVFVAGQLGVNPDGTLAGPDAETQTRRIFANIEALLAAQGVGPQHLVKLVTLLAGTEHLAGYRTATSRPRRSLASHWQGRTTRPKSRRSRRFRPTDSRLWLQLTLRGDGGLRPPHVRPRSNEARAGPRIAEHHQLVVEPFEPGSRRLDADVRHFARIRASGFRGGRLMPCRTRLSAAS